MPNTTVGKRSYRKLYDLIGKFDWFKKAYHGKSLGADEDDLYQKGYSDGQLDMAERAAKWIEEWFLNSEYAIEQLRKKYLERENEI